MAAVIRTADPDALAVAAAERIAGTVRSAVERAGDALVVLAGGHTPEGVYRLLADPAARYCSDVPWSQIYVTWSDERHVSPDHPDSNFGMARRTLLAHVPVDPRRVYRMHGELADAVAAAAATEADLRGAAIVTGRDGFTADLTLLGIGEDAHIASLFPGSPLLAPGDESGDHGRIVAAAWVPRFSAWRITLTPAALRRSRAILVLAAGEAKATAVHAALEMPLDVRRYPAQLLREAADRTTWILDEGAAARLRAVPPA